MDGVQYRQPLNYHVDCKGSASAGMELMLTIKGDVAAFDTTKSSLQSSVQGLAIRILQNGSPMVINQKYKVTPTAMPTLEAVPVKQNGVTLKEGPFEAVANLIAEYQ
ncbi:fimbrial protein [Erwinia aphidicola]|nr:fimbrial protein [Erwinia aphidicola]